MALRVSASVALAILIIGCVAAPSPTLEPTRPVPTRWPTASPSPTHTPLPTLTPSPFPTATPTPVPGLAWAALRDLAYPIDGVFDGAVTLIDGRSPDDEAVPQAAIADIHAYGDLDGDLVDDAVVVLAVYSGGDIPDLYLSAVLNRAGTPEPTMAVPIEEQVILRSITVQAGRVATEMIVQDPDDPLGYPVEDSRRVYELIEGKLEMTSRWDAPAKSALVPTDASPAPLEFLPGAQTTMVRGAMSPVGDRRFLIPGVVGDTATLTVTSPYEHVFLSISGVEDGILLHSVISETTTWTGPLPSTQDYLVTLVSLSGSVTPFTLEVALSNPPVPAQARPTVSLTPTSTPQTATLTPTATITPTPTISVTAPPPTSVRRVPPGSTLYLTFDDGPGAGDWTSRILEMLAEYDARATFFVVGSSAEQSPGLVQAALSAGHAVAGHTEAHQTLDPIGRKAFFEALASTMQVLPGSADTCLRPPYGALDAYTRVRAEELGYRVVLWDVDSEDWRRPGADVIAGRIVTGARPGAVLRFHDGGGDRAQTLAALEAVLPVLHARGYTFELPCRR